MVGNILCGLTAEKLLNITILRYFSVKHTGFKEIIVPYQPTVDSANRNRQRKSRKLVFLFKINCITDSFDKLMRALSNNNVAHNTQHKQNAKYDKLNERSCFIVEKSKNTVNNAYSKHT
jgi:hypothetical protein